MRRWPARGTTLLFAILAVSVSHAAMVEAASKVIDAFRIEVAPELDGKLDDDAWAFATVIEDFYQVEPDEYAAPTEKSRVYVVYTHDALYIAGRFWDSEPEKVNAMVLRQGDFSYGEDSLTVMVDPFNNGRSGYAFDLTANGVRSQAVYANVTSENWQWQGIWHGATQRDGEGWTAEIEIPFKTLSFDPDGTTWGLNFARYIGRKSEHIGWVSENHAQNPAASGKMTGMTGMQQGAGLDVVPGLRATQSRNFTDGTTTSDMQPSVDIFYKVTPGLTSAVTVNTDFSGTGVDERQVNLTRFGLFVREQRGFFLQDADIFEFGRIGGRDYKSRTTLSRVEQESGRPFFSRRIGLSDAGMTVGIDAGVKLAGRVGRWDLGLLAIQQEESGDVASSDLYVARLAANVLAESSVGIMLTEGDPNSNVDNSLAGIDFRYLNTRLASGGTIEAGFWYQQTSTPGLTGDDAAYGFSLAAPNAAGFRGAMAYKELQRNYHPALGFANRVNVRDATAELGYTWYPNAGMFRSIYSGADVERIETLGGTLQSQVITLRPLELTSDHSDTLSFQYILLEEQLDVPFEISEGVFIPAGAYAFDQYCILLKTGESRALTSDSYYCGGEFYDGTQDAMGTELIWRPSPHLKVSAGYDFNDIAMPYGKFITRLTSLRADIAFTNTWYWENFLQYDNVSYSLGLNSILRWLPRAGRQLVLVVNREFVDYSRDRSFTTVSGDITLKFSYTFRF